MRSTNLRRLSEKATNTQHAGAMFTDRATAGQELVKKVQEQNHAPDLILAIGHDGLPIGKAVAEATGVPLEAVAVNTIEAPFNRNVSIGAVTAAGTTWLDEDRIEKLDIDEAYVTDGIRAEQRRSQERSKQYRRLPDITDATIALATDSVTKGHRIRAVAKELYAKGASRITLLTPAIPPNTLRTLEDTIDNIVYLETPEPFLNVEQHYAEYRDVTDADASDYLASDR